MSTTFNLLLIEDSPSDARILEDRLAEGFLGAGVVQHERTLAAGLERLSRGGVDAILLDLGLPDSAGLDTFRRVAETETDAAVVIVSGLSDTRLAEEAVTLGAQDYLVKDEATPEGLNRAITYAVRRHRLLGELDRARQAQLDAKDHLLSHVSHELRTPLAAAYQFVSLLDDETAGTLSDDQRECLDIAMCNMRQLVVMVDDLLTVGRLQSGSLPVNAERVQLHDIATECIGGFGPSAKRKDVSLRSELPSLPEVLCDPWRTREILNNLVDNALKFTPAGGSVTVRAVGGDERVRVSVLDTGRGVRSEHREAVFEQFFQETGDDGSGRAGLGLGLYVCRQLVERQGGVIWVEEPSQGGAEFTFTVPLAPPEQGAQP